jgi:hypothetical protein
MTIFEERFECLPKSIARDMKKCLKKPIPIKATQMYGEFRVKTMEGDFKQGKAGDYLMCGVLGELYICDKEVFEKTYNFID